MKKKKTESDDTAFMRAALSLARRGLGRTAPNPAVGCLIVRPDLGDRVVGRGWTQPGGRPHAETEALKCAGDLAAGATAYVTFEPCSHTGATPPCTDALIEAGIAHAVIATVDPDPRVSGQGIERLKAAGIEVSHGICEAEARAVNAGFIARMTRGRPWVTLKTATTLDGRIATRTGDSQWVTGPEARAEGHRLRASHDAVLAGIGTVLADDPALTCRLAGLEDRSPVRVVMDSGLRLPRTCRLANTARDLATWVLTTTDKVGEADHLRATGVEVIGVETDTEGRPAPAAALAALAGRGITRLLLEAGPGLSAAFLRAGLVDAIAWFRTAAVMGEDGLSAVGAIGTGRLQDLRRYRYVGTRCLGDDVLERYERPDTATE